MKNKGLSPLTRSEREFARLAGLSRSTLRGIKSGEANMTMKTLERMAEAEHQNLQILKFPKDSMMNARYSVALVSFLVEQEGFDSWKIHFFDFVDEVRRSHDARLLIAPPVLALDIKLRALLSAIVLELCRELQWQAPHWALQTPRLAQPWFVSNSNALKASALLESPLRFKLKNIFVLKNFMNRV